MYFHFLDVVEVWCSCNVKRKYVYNHFDVFAKANGQNIELKSTKKGEAKQGQKVVLLM